MEPPLDPAPRASRGLLSLCVLLALLTWVPSIFSAGFSYDDREAILENPVVTGELPRTAAFDRDYWHHRGDAGHYRPLAILTLRLDYALWENDPRGFHFTNVLLHAGVVLLLGLWLGQRSPPGVPWLGLAIFAAHPVLADSVAWVSGRTSMLCALGGLLGAVQLARSKTAVARTLACTIGVLLALLSKEDGIVFAVAYFAFEKKHRRTVVAGTLIAVFTYAKLRSHALGSSFPEAPGAPLADATLLERMHVGGFAILEALRLSAFPFFYPPHYRVQDVAPPSSFATSSAAVLAWVGLAFLLVRPLWKRTSSSAALSGAVVAAAALPVLQLVPAGEVFAPRFLYPLLLFGAPLLDALLRRSLPSSTARGVVFALLLVVAIPTAWKRSAVYKTRGSYRSAVLELHPDDARSWNGLGHDYFERGLIDAAREAWERATEIEPSYSRPWTNLGISYYTEGDSRLALPYFVEAVETGPQNPVAHIWLGRARLERSQVLEARDLFLKATKLAPGMAAGWNGLAKACLELNHADGARMASDRAQRLAPTDKETLEVRARIRDLED